MYVCMYESLKSPPRAFFRSQTIGQEMLQSGTRFPPVCERMPEGQLILSSTFFSAFAAASHAVSFLLYRDELLER